MDEEEVPFPERMREAAETVVRMFREQTGTELTYDLEGVRWIDGYINRVRKNFPAGQREGLVAYLAAFVGECIVHIYGGHWKQDEKVGWGVQATKRICAFPEAKIEKQFEKGAEESVYGFVEMIPVMDQVAATARPPGARKDPPAATDHVIDPTDRP